MSKKKKGMLIISGLLAVTAVFTVISVLAVHDLDLFELDRNAVDDGTVDGDDWGTLYTGGGSAADFTGIIEDTTATNPLGTVGTQFQAGGSKDDLDISPGGATGQYWKWDEGEPLDKDDITNAYAAAYVNDVESGDNHVGDLIVFFGLDRFANNGSAQVGFWFLQDSSFGLTTTKDGGGYRFSGHHMVGDILVQSNFTQGGLIDSISVYEWVGSGGSKGTLDLLFDAQDCQTPGLAEDAACATVNQGDTSSPWPFTPKFGTSGTFPQGSFFEGGINISRLVPDAGCFTGFLAETRSSTPFDSRLKDFAYGDFNLCSIDVTKTGDPLSKVGDDVDYTITIQNTGAITLYKDDISDTVFNNLVVNGVDQTDPNAYTSFNFATGSPCGASLAPGATCTIEVTRTVQAGDPDPLPNTATAVYNDKDDFSGTAVSDFDDHSVNLFQPAISATKECTDLSKIGDLVQCTVVITNDSSDDTPDLVFDKIDDTVQGDLMDDTNYTNSTCGTSIAWDESCTILYDYTVPEDADDPYLNEVTIQTHPGPAFDNDIDTTASDSVNLFQPDIGITKECTDLSKIGDPVNCTVVITNESSDDTPDLVIESISDTVQGDLTDSNNYTTSDCGSSIAWDENCTITYSYDVPQDAEDPYPNTVTVETHPTGFTNDIDADSSDSVNLFQPDISVTKECTDLSKIGDPVSCTVVITNDSSNDTPDLVIESISDTVQGDLTSAANYTSSDCGASIAWDESCTITYSYNVPSDASDPYPNKVTVETHPTGFTNDIDADASDSVNLFQPDISVTKECTDLSKIGDLVSCTVVITNESSNDSPDLVFDKISDTVQGNLTNAANYTSSDCGASIAWDESCTITYSYNVPSDAPDPYPNKVTVETHPTGFTNDIDANASDSVNLFQPSINVTKTGDAYSKAGDSVSYSVTIENTSSADSPALVFDLINDSLKGDLTNVANYDSSTCGASLAAQTSCQIDYSYTVLGGDPDPLLNTVTVESHPDGFTNDIDDSDGHSVDLIHPDFTVAKTCDAEPVSSSGPASFTVTIANTGDVSLNVTADDGIGSFQLDVGETQYFPVSVSGPFTAGGTADNTVNATWTLPAEYGLSNTDTKSASASCAVSMPEFQTAYAMGNEEDIPVCFIDLGANSNNWGWVNGDGATAILPGEYTWDVWAGAAQCKTNKGTLVGTVDVNYTGTNVLVTWHIDPLYILGDTHVYAGLTQVPPGGFAPGQYQIYGPFSGEAIYVIVHAMVGIP